MRLLPDVLLNAQQKVNPIGQRVLYLRGLFLLSFSR